MDEVFRRRALLCLFCTQSLIVNAVQPRFIHLPTSGRDTGELSLPPHGAKVEAKRSNLKNAILASLSPKDLERLRPHLERVDLPMRKVLEARNRRIEHIYFPESGLASVVLSSGSLHSIEVGVIGFEGMTAPALVMGVDRSPYEIFVQAAGTGWRVAAGALTSVMGQSESLRQTLLRHAYLFQIQSSCTALANGRYKLEERLARWLLMAQDRMQDETVDLTHEFLSLMLGVRRPGVTAALNAFEERGLIRGHRGGLTILNREALRDAANGSYGTPEAEYQRLFGEE
jgi:CRP-like cAMP-binding protein